MTRYDPHPQAHDDARSTPSGFTTGPSAAQNGSGVPEEGGGLREALEALADEWTYKGEHGWGPWQAGEGPSPEGWVLDHAATTLRSVLAAHPADAPEAQEPSGDVVEEVARLAHSTLLNHRHGSSCNSPAPEHRWDAVSTGRAIARALADAGLLVDPAETERLLTRWAQERETYDRTLLQARHEVDALIGERDELQANANRDADEWVKAERKRDELEAEVRVQRTEKWRVIGAMREDLDKAELEAEAAEARAHCAEDALRELTEAAFRLCVAVDIHPERLRPTLRRKADKCRQALDWARAALSAADQTSDATPTDTTTEGA